MTIFLSLLFITIAAGVIGFLLQWLNSHFTNNNNAMAQWIQKIDDCLPQLQCGECNYPGCKPYAIAIAKGEVGIDQCPPGGSKTAQDLAKLLGQEAPSIAPTHPQIALIEDHCVGCALCLEACPTDAIIGSPQQRHVVINEACVGCGLCLPPCPVDCIRLLPSYSMTSLTKGDS